MHLMCHACVRTRTPRPHINLVNEDMSDKSVVRDGFWRGAVGRPNIWAVCSCNTSSFVAAHERYFTRSIGSQWLFFKLTVAVHAANNNDVLALISLSFTEESTSSDESRPYCWSAHALTRGSVKQLKQILHPCSKHSPHSKNGAHRGWLTGQVSVRKVLTLPSKPQKVFLVLPVPPNALCAERKHI